MDAMPARKMRVEVFDDEGNSYSIAFKGRLTRQKALCLLDIVELLGGVHPKQELTHNLAVASKFDRVRFIVEKRFPVVWFSSGEVVTVFEQDLSEPISLSTVSTYLARMADRGLLLKRASAGKREYRLMTQLLQRQHTFDYLK